MISRGKKEARNDASGASPRSGGGAVAPASRGGKAPLVDDQRWALGAARSCALRWTALAACVSELAYPTQKTVNASPPWSSSAGRALETDG
jgi:hypothetical protein